MLRHIDVPLPGLLIVKNQLDLVIGFSINTDRVLVILRCIFTNEQVIRHSGDVPQRQCPEIIKHDIHLSGVQQGNVQRVLHDVKQSLPIFHPGFDLISGILDLAGVQIEIRAKHLQKLSGRLIFIHICVFVFEIPELVIRLYFHRAALFRSHLKDKAIKYSCSVHSQPHGIAAAYLQHAVPDHGKIQLPRAPVTVRLPGDSFFHSRSIQDPLMLNQKLDCHAHLLRHGQHLAGINQVGIADLVPVRLKNFCVV